MLANLFVPALIVAGFAARIVFTAMFKRDPELSKLMKQTASA